MEVFNSRIKDLESSEEINVKVDSKVYTLYYYDKIQKLFDLAKEDNYIYGKEKDDNYDLYIGINKLYRSKTISFYKFFFVSNISIISLKKNYWRTIFCKNIRRKIICFRCCSI